MPRLRPGLRPRLATAAAVLAVTAVLVMHGGLDARALASHLPVAAADGGVHSAAGHGGGPAAAVATGHGSPPDGSPSHAAHGVAMTGGASTDAADLGHGRHDAGPAVAASPREVTAASALASTTLVPSDVTAADHAAHGHALGHALAACVAVLLVVGVLVALVALGGRLRRGVALPWTWWSSPATWLDRLVPVPPPRVALCVERC